MINNSKQITELQKKDMKYIFHPCSQMKDYEALPPMVITHGKGVYVTDESGKKYLDCVSSWWVNLFGHSNERINKALIDQVQKLEHIIFANFTHKPAIELGELLIEIAPKGLEKIFFADNGSSSIEIALKLSFQYHKQTKNSKKKKFISLENGYHGETLGALGITDVALFTDIYKPLINESIKVKGPSCFKCEYSKKRETCSAECFEHMEKVILENHYDISGVIIEPIVQGAGGMKIYSPVYLKKLRKITQQYNINFIADEIAVGFGRTGKMFALEHANISPDIMCVGKGLTAGYFPMSLVLMTGKIYDEFYSDYSLGKSFLHSHSYSGNPLGCAVAVESLKIFKEENILKTIESKGEYLRKNIKKTFVNNKWIGEYRQIGLIGALELVNKNKKNFNPKLRIGYEIYKIALSKGAILRPIGNVIYFMPPYVISEKEIDEMIRICKESIEEFFNNFYREEEDIYEHKDEKTYQFEV